MDYSYDLIYGVDLEEYCALHNITVDDLIKMVEIDIKILKKNLQKETRETLPGLENWDLIANIKSVLDKKEKHLKRLKTWRNGISNS